MVMKRGKVGFVGAGNMATALVKGLIQSGLYPPEQIRSSDISGERLKRINEQFGLKVYTSNTDMVRDCSVIVLSIKPQNMKEVLGEIRDEIKHDQLIISIAAGIPLGMIRERIGRDIPMVRVMPNTPALIQKGMSALAAGEITPSNLRAAGLLPFVYVFHGANQTGQYLYDATEYSKLADSEGIAVVFPDGQGTSSATSTARSVR